MPPFLPRKRLRTRSPSPVPGPSKRKDKATTSTPPRKPTLFEALDAGTTRNQSAGHTKNLLAKLDGTDDESELSSLSESEPEFEDVPKSKRHGTNAALSEDEDDIEFEDVHTYTAPRSAAPPPSGDLDLTLTKETRVSLVNPHNKKQGPSKIERQIRVSTHQMHVQFLMWHNAIRNAWICDKEIQGILVKQFYAIPGVESDIQKWKLASGLASKEEEGGHAKEKGKGKRGKNKQNAGDERSQRDWGSPAQRLATATVDLSHGDPLFRLMKRLSFYWKQKFRITSPGLKKLGYMSLPRIDDEIKSFKTSYDHERHGERFRNRQEFKVAAEKCEGSRDVGSQLFTALLRGIGLDARMVASLQPVGFSWSKNEEAAERKKSTVSAKTAERDLNQDDESSLDENPKAIQDKRSKGKQTGKPKQVAKTSKGATTSNKRKGGKDEPIDLSDSEEALSDESVVDVTPIRQRRGPSKVYEKDLTPNYWVEALSPATNLYVPVNPWAVEPAASNPELVEAFAPRGVKAEKAKQVMAYVVGFSADGTAKDVTIRYLKRHMWPGKTKGYRIPVEKVPVYNSRGKIKRHEEFDWFKTVMSGYTRRGNRRTFIDDQEEATDLKAVQPEKKEVKEGEETLQSYKSSAEFVLERHLRREEALVPTAQHVKLFTIKGKGDAPVAEEKVYLRSDVVNCKSVETWHKEGRAPIIGEQPLKRVPYRAATTNRKRELAEAEAASGGEKMLQGLYSRAQTDWIIPPPIENGVIPKNGYGNMDVYVPSMVPEGAVHIPRRGTMRICKKLGIDFAEAVTGFEFGARMAIPIITGVVVAEENEEMVIEQWKIDEAERLRKEDEKRTKAALGMWRKFLMGLRIVERVRDEYGDQVDENPDVLNPWTNKNRRGGQDRNSGYDVEAETARRIMDQHDEDMAGGFLPPGHDEEEPAPSFFPTRHEDNDDDEGGGFIIEGHDQPETLNKPTAIEAYATPISILSHKRGLSAAEDSDGKELGLGQPPLKKIPTIKTPRKRPEKAKAATAPRSKAKTPAKPARNNTGPSRKRNKSKKTSSENENEDDESSPLSDVESEIMKPESEPAELSTKSKRHASMPRRKTTRVETPRAVPKRKAARKSETALKSHYFEHSTDEAEDDNDDDEDDEEE